jgi:signal recognition particle GTPase
MLHNEFGPKKRMTEASIKPALRDVRRALLDADVISMLQTPLRE